MFEVKQWPFFGESLGLADFGDSLAVQSELESTKISSILHKFEISGVLPHVGRAALPADVFLGGEDFQSLSDKLSDARNSGITEEMLNDERERSDVDTADSEHGSEGRVEPAADEQPGQQQ